MNRIFKILYICTFILYTNICYGADMAGYLLDQAIKQYNDKNYGEAYTALNNIAPTGNPVAIYLLGTIYLNGYGIEKNIQVAHDMILFAAENLPNTNKELAEDAQMLLIDMYANSEGSIKNYIQAYKWAYIVNSTNNNLTASILIKLANTLSDEEISLASNKAKEFLKRIKKNKNED